MNTAGVVWSGRRFLVYTVLTLGGIALVLGALLGLVKWAENRAAEMKTPQGWTRRDIEMIASQGVDAFRVMKGRYPTTEEGIKLLLDEKFLKPNNEHGTLVDLWGREYVYLCPGKVHPKSYDVLSYGRDGRPGGEGEDADFVNP